MGFWREGGGSGGRLAAPMAVAMGAGSEKLRFKGNMLSVHLLLLDE